MLPLAPAAIRASFVNASRKERSDLTLPADFDALDWERLDFLGWRDPKLERRAYVIVPGLEGEFTGILFRHPGSTPRTRAQCSWCNDTTLPNDVVLYNAKRSGAAGKNGNTLSTLVCEDFQCSLNARRPPKAWYEDFDREAARLRQVEELQLRAAAFVAQV
ncbi:FBP domain-containing protein [Demequina zhanjiangensis]|uniref:FBP domain-containing protein n=1 Tax=Demequina zhanjiangensis TaxID=3051659 RepID=A0ABT8G3R3_9MICO|nr:FBP domain-containing protein [Demequina sp. SYSU T00b26]MDN4473712.1 FBP domain-containing protein [Demequina sp. SYSU T00b26]